MGSSISTDKENKKLETDQLKDHKVTKPAIDGKFSADNIDTQSDVTLLDNIKFENFCRMCATLKRMYMEQPDRTNLQHDPKPSVVVTNKHLHEKKGNLQSLQKEPQQDRTRSITTPKPSVVFTTKNLPQQTSSLKTKQITKEVIAAIEIGCTHSGYVFCLDKSLLWREPDTSVHSIGYEAEEYVSRIQGEPDSGKWFFFKNFMVECYKLKQNNVTMKAVDVIFSFINQMKDKLVNELIRRPLGYNDNDIQWVITTPGKFAPPINNLMKTAVTKAGIKPAQLNIVQGPEAELRYNQTFTGSPSSFGEEQIAPLPKLYRRDPGKDGCETTAEQ
ncbi:unnamed protein product [Mytilus edulis]|uniref:Uncharacterized protein n=1 Tax=Mytilus edulis TaxID=6550 RepID=A0A8S3RMR8_MYTED|nr:unnamed protein product [Mytilus edulis]